MRIKLPEKVRELLLWPSVPGSDSSTWVNRMDTLKMIWSNISQRKGFCGPLCGMNESSIKKFDFEGVKGVQDSLGMVLESVVSWLRERGARALFERYYIMVELF